MRAKYPMLPDASQVSGRVVLQHAIVHLEDALADPGYDKRFAEVGGWRRMLGVPLLREGRILGAIVVGWQRAGPIEPGHELLLTTFAEQAAIAIEKPVRLFNATQEALERQTATTEVLQVINASPGDTAPGFDAIARKAMQLCAADMGGLWVVEGETALARGAYNVPEAYMSQDLKQRVAVKHIYGSVTEGPPFLHIADLRETKAYQKRLPAVVAPVELGSGRTCLMVPLRDGDTLRTTW